MYAIIKVVNGNYVVEVEGITNLDNAKINFHNLCKNLWAASDCNTATVIIADENLDAVEGYKECINKQGE